MEFLRMSAVPAVPVTAGRCACRLNPPDCLHTTRFRRCGRSLIAASGHLGSAPRLTQQYATATLQTVMRHAIPVASVATVNSLCVFAEGLDRFVRFALPYFT
jgi:hypothetical protein